MTSRSGLEWLESWVAGEPQQPFNETTRIAFVEARPGHVTNELDAGIPLTDESGHLVPGVAVAVADGALGAAIFSLLPAGLGSVTTRLHLDVLPDPGETRHLTARARAIHLGVGSGLSKAEIVDGEGRLRAVGTARSAIRNAGDMAAIEWEPEHATAAEVHASQPDLQIRRENGTPSDLQVLLGTPALSRVGVRLSSQDERSVVVSFDVRGLANWWDVVHGGAVAMLADITGAVALHALLPPHTPIVLVDHDLTFLRPLPTAPAVECRAEITHRSRTLAVVRADVVGPAGLAASATITAIVT